MAGGSEGSADEQVDEDESHNGCAPECSHNWSSTPRASNSLSHRDHSYNFCIAASAAAQLCLDST
jgi:hypothetical protein